MGAVCTSMNGCLSLLLLSSYSAYRLADFRASPYDKSTSIRLRLIVFPLSRTSALPLCTSMNKALSLFFLSSYWHQRLANFTIIPTISQHRFACGLSCFLYLVRFLPVFTSLNGCLRFSCYTGLIFHMSVAYS